MHRVARKIKDKRVLKLIGKYLRAGVVLNGRRQDTRKGVPQGGPLSPLLANILLDDLDKELEKRGHRFVRYADDFLVLVKSHRAGVRVSQSIERFLNRRLKLKVNKKKSQVAKTDDTDFLGFTFKGTKIRWSDKAFHQFRWRIKRLTGRSWFVSMEYRMKKIAQYPRGWLNYFGISEYYSPIPEIDHWLRRRVRMCYWKRWRYVRTRVRNLLKMGTHPNVAIPMSFSRKGPWKCARTLATQTGMTNQWLKDQGLLNVKELWVNTCPAIVINGGGFITQLRSGNLSEPRSADPLAAWCGGWGRKTPGYPIGHYNIKLLLSSNARNYLPSIYLYDC